MAKEGNELDTKLQNGIWKDKLRFTWNILASLFHIQA